MNLDLTGLAEAGQSAAGEPLMLSLGVIALDPNQPRKEFNEEALQELAASIGALGVVQPISVRPDASMPGRYIINYGERRYRAALIAGLNAVPVFLHRTPDSYTQVAENLHRADLSPMEMALFIRARLDAGEKKTDIAARLGYKKSYVTEHLALLESPACVEKAYANGVSSARTLYDLRRLHDEFPEAVDAWCAAGAEVTRESIAALSEKVRHDEQSGVQGEVWSVSQGGVSSGVTSEAGHPASIDHTTEKVRHDEQPPVRRQDLAWRETAPITSAGAITGDTHAHAGSSLTLDNALRETSALARRLPAALRIQVRHDGRRAIVQDDSVLHIRYEDGSTAEVRLADAVVVAVSA